MRRFRLVHPLPRYLIFHYKRFRLNNFFVEKNPTLVTFPVKNLEMKDYIDGEMPKGANYGTKYNLVSNITHQGKPDAGHYICHVLNRATDEWYNVQDLHVQEILAQQVALKETYLQIFERIDQTPEERAAAASAASALAADDALDSMLDNDSADAAASLGEIFVAADEFGGQRAGYSFKKGEKGLGYYRQ